MFLSSKQNVALILNMHPPPWCVSFVSDCNYLLCKDGQIVCHVLWGAKWCVDVPGTKSYNSMVLFSSPL